MILGFRFAEIIAITVPIESTRPDLSVRGETEGCAVDVEVQCLEVRELCGCKTEQTGVGVHDGACGSLIASEGIAVEDLKQVQSPQYVHG